MRATHPQTHLYSLLKVCVITRCCGVLGTSSRWGSVHLTGREGINKYALCREGIIKHALYREDLNTKNATFCVTLILSSIAALN